MAPLAALHRRRRSGGPGRWCAVAITACACSLMRRQAFVAAELVRRPPAANARVEGGLATASGARRGGRLGPARGPHPARGDVVRAAGEGGSKTLDIDALTKYGVAILFQMACITAFFGALDVAAPTFKSAATAWVPSIGEARGDWAVFLLFYAMSIRSRIFSPLDNSRPDIIKASAGQATGGFNDRQMPSWTPPGITFPIMWLLIVAPLRAASSVLVWNQVGHLCDFTILTLMLHLCFGDTWNTINNVEKRLGAAVPGVLCVWITALFAAFCYYQVDPTAGQLLLPVCLWLTVAGTLITDTWRINNTSGDEPLYPYEGPVSTQFWFMAKQ